MFEFDNDSDWGLAVSCVDSSLFPLIIFNTGKCFFSKETRDRCKNRTPCNHGNKLNIISISFYAIIAYKNTIPHFNRVAGS